MSIQFARPVKLLMMGAPGVGKGTFSRILSKDIQLPELSSGAELRRIKDSGKGEIAEEIKRIQQEGGLVSDSIVLKMIVERLKDDKYKRGAILDGFPRTKAQAISMGKYTKIDMCIKIDINQNILTKKCLGRRECKNCQKNYNIFAIKNDEYDMKPLLPKVEGVCDECGGELIKRADDNVKTIKKRMETYRSKTVPMEEYFMSSGTKVMTFEPKRGVKDYEKFKKMVLDNLNDMNLLI